MCSEDTTPSIDFPAPPHQWRDTSQWAGCHAGMCLLRSLLHRPARGTMAVPWTLPEVARGSAGRILLRMLLFVNVRWPGMVSLHHEIGRRIRPAAQPRVRGPKCAPWRGATRDLTATSFSSMRASWGAFFFGSSSLLLFPSPLLSRYRASLCHISVQESDPAANTTAWIITTAVCKPHTSETTQTTEWKRATVESL
jgi:hypothetical protein